MVSTVCGCLFDFHGYMYSVVVVMLSKDITTLYMYTINLFNSSLCFRSGL